MMYKPLVVHLSKHCQEKMGCLILNVTCSWSKSSLSLTNMNSGPNVQKLCYRNPSYVEIEFS